MENIAHTANRAAGNSLRFLFAPQLFNGLRPSRTILLSFVQIIAQFLATAQLIPATHRALRPVTVADARLGDVLALAYANARRPGTRLDQWTVLAAATALMGLLCIMTLYTIVTMLMGTAHAAITISFSFGGCSYSSSSLFASPCSSDMAQQWIDMLLLGATNWFSAQVVSVPVAAGMAAMFQTYSMAMLVIAGFLVLYHLLVIIAGTAHEGKFGGRAMNQVWAPIRLVAAIGMLVPLGVNGLNSGQMIVTQVAKWGSGLASNIWLQFANTYAANAGAYIIMPPLPIVSGAAEQALLILTCYHGTNSLFADHGSTSKAIVDSGTTWYYGAGMKTVRRSWDYVDTGITPADYEEAACGSIELPNPDYSASGTAFQFLGLGSSFNANDSLRHDILLAQKNAMDNMMAPGGDLDELAQTIYDSADTAVTGTQLQEADIKKFNDAVAQYRADLATGVAAAISASAAASGFSMAADAMARGWLSAGVWFNEIARVNGMLIDYTKKLPDAQFSYQAVIPYEDTERLMTALDSVQASLEALPQMASTGTTFTLAEPDAVMYISNVSAGDDPLAFFLNTLAIKMAKFLGTMSNSPDEISTGLPAYAVPFQLNTGNPLAELSALGYRMIAFTRETAKEISMCYAEADSQRASLASENRPGFVGPSSQGVKSACGAVNGSVGPTTFMMQSITGMLLMAGVTMAFYLPMIPFIRFMFGILAWVLALFETVIAIPVVALAHIKMEGDGLAGPLARSAYMLMLQLFLRPTLMVFGLILALLVFNLMIVALNEFYSGAIRSVEGGGDIGAVSGVVYTIIYGSLAYAFANASFKAIDMVPNQCLQWIGGANTSSLADVESVSRALGTAGQSANQAMLASGQASKAAMLSSRYI